MIGSILAKPDQSRFSGLLKVAALGGALAASAYLLTLATSGPLSWLGWVALLPLFVAIRVLPPLKASLAGGFWGVSLVAASLSSAVVPFDPTILACTLLTLVPAGYCAAGSFVTRRAGFSPLLLGVGWVAVEFALRPLALTNGLLAGTQHDAVLLGVVGNAVGYVIVAFIVAYATAAILSVLTHVYGVVSSSRPIVSAAEPYLQLSSPHTSLFVWHLLRLSNPRGPPVTA